MVKTIKLDDLMREVGIDHQGSVSVTDEMSGLEPNPKNDWLYYSLIAFQLIKLPSPYRDRKPIHSAAFIGSGNGIETIGSVNIFPGLTDICVTDLLPNILPKIEENIRNNLQEKLRGKNLIFKAGRDCEPLEGRVDLIYGNLPLVAIGADDIRSPLATTTLTDIEAYRGLVNGENDPLRRYSLLTQLGFLLSAEKKLNENGTFVTMIGGRVPYEVIEECFKRAGLEHNLLLTGFKKQSDSQFLEQYADLERREGIEFTFYDYEHALRLLQEQGKKAPGILSYFNRFDETVLAPARLNAKQAFEFYKQGKDVGHLAYAFEAQ